MSGVASSLASRRNHELHELHENGGLDLEGQFRVVARAHEASHREGLLAEIGQKAYRQSTCLEVMDHLRVLNASHDGLGLEFHQYLSRADEISPIHGPQDILPEADGNGSLALELDATLKEGQLDSLLIGLLQVSGAHVSMDVQECS